MFINRKSCLAATLLLFSLGRWGTGIGSDPLLDRLLSTDPGIQAQAVKELNGLPSGQKRIMVDELAQALHANAASAQKAAHVLAQVGTDAAPAIADLVDALHYDEDAVYAEARDALVKSGPAALSPLRGCLSDSNFFVRRRAAEILGRFGARARSAAPQLVQLLKDPEASVHDAAESALLQMGDSAISALADDLPRESSESDRRSLVLSLGKFGKPAAPALLRVLKKDENAFVRGAAAEGLSQMRETSPEVISALMEALHDLNDGMRVSAVDALGQIGPSAAQALGELIVLSHADGVALVRAKAREAAEHIGRGNKESLPGFAAGLRQPDVDARMDILDTLARSDLSFDDALPLMVISQKDENPAIRIKGLIAASKLQRKSSAALQMLAVAMTDPQPDVRSAAMQEIGGMKQDPSAAANALGAGLKDPNPPMRQQAIAALSKLGPAAVPFLIQELSDSYTVLSDQAARAILKQGPGAVPALEAAAAGADAVLSKKARALLKRIHRRRSQSSD